MAGPKYCTIEDVKGALDVKASAYADKQILRAIESASRAIDGQMHRTFWPQVDTRYFDWPNRQYAPAQTLWLEQHELLSVTTLTAGGVAIPAADFDLEPNGDGPPFDRIELDLSSSASFGGGTTFQRSISITGVFGYGNDTDAAGALAEALDGTETGVDVTDSSLVGTGDTILIGTEYMSVTGRSMLATGVTIHASDSLTASAADVSILCSSATGIPQVGEVVLIDSERMLVVDLAGTTLTVKRAHDGTVLAAHAALAGLYAPRTLTVVRGALGTTAAAHADTTAVSRHAPPGLIRDLAIAEAIVRFEQEGAGYARTVGSGESERNASLAGLVDLRQQAARQYRRKARMRAI
jgi:hypothetical protein